MGEAYPEAKVAAGPAAAAEFAADPGLIDPAGCAADCAAEGGVKLPFKLFKVPNDPGAETPCFPVFPFAAEYDFLEKS